MEYHFTLSSGGGSYNLTMDMRRIMAIKGSEATRLTKTWLVGRMPNTRSYWCHSGFRINRADLEGKSHSEREEVVKTVGERFKEFIVAKAKCYILAVGHCYYDINYEDRWDHIHVLYRHYKGCAATAAIRDFCVAREYSFWYSEVRYPANFIEYLLQGGGRKVLFETGRRPTEGFPGRDYSIRRDEEMCLCEPKFGDGGGGPEDTGACPGARRLNTSARDISLSRSGRIQTAKAEQREELWNEIRALLVKYRTTDEISFGNKILGSKDNELISWYNHNRVEASWKDNYETATSAYQVEIMNMKWEDIINQLPEEGEEYEKKCMGVEESMHHMVKLCEHQGVNIKDLTRDIWATLDKWHQRKNTLLIHGASETGKSWLGDSIAQAAIIVYNNGTFNRSAGGFPFQDFIRKRLARIEECNITADWVENIKCLFGGQPLDVAVKYKNAGKVGRVPIVCTTNVWPWQYCQQAEKPLRDRCYIYQFNRRINWHIPGSIHPRAFLALAKYYGYTAQPISTAALGGSFEPSMLGDPGPNGGGLPALKRYIEEAEPREGSGPRTKRRRMSSETSTHGSSGDDDILQCSSGQETPDVCEGVPEGRDRGGDIGLESGESASESLLAAADGDIGDFSDLISNWGDMDFDTQGGGGEGPGTMDTGAAIEEWLQERKEEEVPESKKRTGDDSSRWISPDRYDIIRPGGSIEGDDYWLCLDEEDGSEDLLRQGYDRWCLWIITQIARGTREYVKLKTYEEVKDEWHFYVYDCLDDALGAKMDAIKTVG
uniref:Nonstructural protein n=1 Tax=Parvoviridae sp. TaxID=1940570 RepID=A0A7D3QIR3_9VIRU|nr:MAG: nonstructural protein [Parvoviridae sp.]